MNTKPTISLKLLVDKNSKKVIFAEAGKDFVDFLFGLLELPLGSLMAVLGSKGVAESWTFGKVYESVKNLNPDYLQPEQTKTILLQPQKPYSNTKATPLLQQFGYGKPQSSSYSSYGSSSNASKEVDGYVKGMVTYMILDDLTVKPVSTISSITLLNTFAVKDIGNLQEKNVEVNRQKALELVKTSFESTTVLTDVFIGKIQR